MPLLLNEETPRDVVDALEQLLAGAKEGQVVGLAFAALLKRRRFITAAAGECHRDPTYTRGIIAALDDELSHLVQHRADHTTR